ncbi:MAG TPA: zinc-binding dehydrogenase, partial [Ilumatobacteraceae bacterium]|nr:zinc-binding dehydrogenase [Ilumatobacteraceae bacterium]
VEIPTTMPDEQAVMIEPAACAIHAAAQVAVAGMSAAGVNDAGTVAIIGAGTFGLLTVAALQARRQDEGLALNLVVAARYPQQVGAARMLGADRVMPGAELARSVRRMTASMAIGDQLTGGAETVIDCVGSSDSLAQALQIVAPGGTVLMVGMPNTVSLNLTALWHREVAIRGCYAYQRADFDRAIDLVERFDLGRFVTETYPIAQFAEAIDHAANAGRRGAIKIAFDLREKN